MTDPKAKEAKPQIKTRRPGKLGGGMFDRVHLRPADEGHPLAHLLGDASPEQSRAAAASPLPPKAGSDASSAQPTSTVTPIETPPVTPIEAPTATPIETATTTRIVSEAEVVASSPRGRAQRAPVVAGAPTPDESQRPVQALDATHTSSEQLVYNYMYRETISRGIRERHFGPKELLKATPIRSHVTVRKAIDGLVEKLSIEIVSNVFGSPFGPRYRVYEPRDITRRRAAAGLQIDPVSKRIVASGDTPTVTATVTHMEMPTATPTEAATGRATATHTTPTATPIDSVGATPSSSVGVTPPNSVGVILNREISSPDVSASAASSSKSEGAPRDDDDAFTQMLSKLREIVKAVTGREPTAADAERWAELGDVLASELLSGSGRTTISSAPAFLAEHLRRRLGRSTAPVPPARPATGPQSPARAPEPPTEDELVSMFTGFLHDGMTIEEIEGQFSASVEAGRWPRIRSAALERYERERGQMRPPDKP